MVFATSNLRLSGAARRQLTCREEVPLRDRRLRRLRRVRNLLPNEIAFLQPSHRQFVQLPPRVRVQQAGAGGWSPGARHSTARFAMVAETEIAFWAALARKEGLLPLLAL